MPQDELRFQYPLLALKFPDDETFASFYPGQNASLLTQLRNSVVGLGEPVLYMWGGIRQWSFTSSPCPVLGG